VDATGFLFAGVINLKDSRCLQTASRVRHRRSTLLKM
jgi:hypothetical protein